MIEFSDKIIQKAMESAIQKWGKGSIVSFDPDDIEERPAISTGALSLDLALGIGGIPEGMMTLILGNPSCGKTTVALSICAQAQKKYPDKSILLVDFEHALDLFYAHNLGIDLGPTIILQPNSGEEGYDIMSMFMATGRFSVAVIDSLAAVQTKEDIEAGPDKNPSLANAARLNARELKRIKTVANRTNTAIVITNQFRTGFAAGFSYKTHPGGITQDYYASVIMELEAEEKPKAAEDAPTSLKVLAKINKNKCAPPYTMAKFDIEFGKGIVEESCTVDVGIKANIIEKAGKWFKYEGQSFNGKEQLISALRADKDLHEKMKAQCFVVKEDVIDTFKEEDEEIIVNEDGEILDELSVEA